MRFAMMLVLLLLGIAFAHGLNAIPPESFEYYVPICWSPKLKCAQSYSYTKTYILAIIMVLCVWLLPC